MAGEARVYSPCLDVGVGPFAVGVERYGDVYDEMVMRHRDWLNELYLISKQNFSEFGETDGDVSFDRTFSFNHNARCFLAIEVENKTSRKHLMGGAINASALGRVGIAVGWTNKQVGRFVRMRRYLRFLASVGKNTFNTTNLLVLSADQLMHTAVQRAPQRATRTHNDSHVTRRR
jgi:hypothetical protein